MKRSELWFYIAFSTVICAIYDYFRDNIESAKFGIIMSLIYYGVSLFYKKQEKNKKEEE